MENNNKVSCPVCNKSFSNGKALGGHMKSHLAKMPIPAPKPPINNQVPENMVESTINPPIHSLTTASSSSIVLPRNNPIHNLRSLKRNFYFTLANYGRNGEFESYPKNPTRKRSKRQRKFFAVAETKVVEHVPRSSTSDDLSAEEAAMTLTIISKDKWPKSKMIQTRKMEKKTNKKETKIAENGNGKDKKLQKCPYCSKIFEVGQALEEHKKLVHSNSKVADTQNIPDESSESFADLSFTTPTKVEETTQIESTMSNKE